MAEGGWEDWVTGTVIPTAEAMVGNSEAHLRKRKTA